MRTSEIDTPAVLIDADVPELGDGPRPRVGDRLHILPNHACVVVNMHDHVYLHRGEDVIACWPVAARGKVR